MTRRLSRRDSAIAFAVLLIAAAAAIWWFHVSPARAQVETRTAELAEVTREVNGLQDTVTRMRAQRPNAAARTVERLRLAKALPVDEQVPEALLQLEDLAVRSGVELTSISAGGVTVHGGLGGAQFELAIAGRFHDVDDFLHRLHNLVHLDESRRPVVSGRLIALRSLSISPESQEGVDGEERPRLGAATRVRATLSIVAYVAPVDGSVDAGPAGVPAVPQSEGAIEGEEGPTDESPPAETIPPASDETVAADNAPVVSG